MQSRHVLVTGAAGFLGGAVARELLARGDRVTALVRSESRARERLADIADRIAFFEWDLNRIAVPEMPAGITHVIHAASQASPRFYGTDPVGTALPNAVGTAALLEAATQAKVKGFLFVSSSEVYGAASSDQPLKESDLGPLDPAAQRACYAESKRMGETLCVAWASQHGLPTLIVRPFHTYGPGLTRDDGRVFADFAYAVAEGRPIVMTSDGSARRAFCYASDAVDGILTVLTKGQPATPYNLANPDAELSVKELAELLVSLYPGSELIQRPPPGGYLPSPFNRLIPDISRLQGLGWQPRISAANGFRRFIDHIRAHELPR
jgi:UDP-glucuronate decarboxylase